jgi:hypothetical protein
MATSSIVHRKVARGRFASKEIVPLVSVTFPDGAAVI